MRTLTFPLILAGLLLTGCMTHGGKDIDYTPARGFAASDQGLVAQKISHAVTRLMAAAEDAATARGENLGQIELRKDGGIYVPENRTVIVTTPVSINHEDTGMNTLPRSNQFGRNAREIIVASIGPRFRIIEPQATTEITMRENEGEFTLDRNLANRAQKGTVTAPADLIIAGTYTEGSGSTQLNLTVLRGQEILSATTIILPYRADLM